MTRIGEDHEYFIDVYGGRIRKALRKYINDGHIFRTRPDGTRMPISIPKMDIPHIVNGSNDKGVGRGPGKDGDTIKKGKQPGQGNKAGDEAADGIIISLDMEEVLKFMEDVLELPALKPKPNESFEDEQIKYNDIARVGPKCLRHPKRTMLQALKRLASTGEINKLYKMPGFDVPVKKITPINSDERYRQYRIIKKPSSNAVVFFARDGSGSMDTLKCDIVSDMCWWMDIWIRKFYKRVESCYIWHDVDAQEVDQNKFYRYRSGGGTKCSSALDLIAKQFDNRFPPNKWNIYVFYFTDGENSEPNDKFINLLKEKFPPNIVNLVGITQVMAPYHNSLKEDVDIAFGTNSSNLKTTSIGNNLSNITDDERDRQTKQAVIDLIGKKEVKSNV